jgi:hypothetical protein
MDCAGSHVLLAFSPAELQLLHFDAAHGRLSPLRDVALPGLGPGRPLQSLALAPPQGPAPGEAGSGGSGAQEPAAQQQRPSTGGGAAAAARGAGAGADAPRQALLLRWGGALSVLELDTGSELLLSEEVRGGGRGGHALGGCLPRIAKAGGRPNSPRGIPYSGPPSTPLLPMLAGRVLLAQHAPRPRPARPR